LEVRRTSGENDVLLENLRACTVSRLDIRSKVSQQTYCAKLGPTVQSMTGDFIFMKPSHSSCFPYSRVFLVEIRLIEGFPQIWRTQIVRNSQRHYSTQLSFNSHNARCYFPCTARLFYVPRKHAYLQLSQFILIAHEL
jgi:hypothetical protein